MSGSRASAVSDAAFAFDVEFVDETGGIHRKPLAASWDLPFERSRPVRSFPSVKGQLSFPGLWWAATTGCHVGYESWVERAVVMMMDFDPEVTGLSSQPFWLHWHDGNRPRRHAPDYFARLADGTGVVVDVRPDDLVDAHAAESFAVTAEACHQVGWTFRRTGGPEPVLAANVRWLAGYRHPRCLRPDAADAFRNLLGRPQPLLAAADAIGDRVAVLPVLYHLMWRHIVLADLAAALLGPDTMVRVAETGAGN